MSTKEHSLWFLSLAHRGQLGLHHVFWHPTPHLCPTVNKFRIISLWLMVSQRFVSTLSLFINKIIETLSEMFSTITLWNLSYWAFLYSCFSPQIPVYCACFPWMESYMSCRFSSHHFFYFKKYGYVISKDLYSSLEIHPFGLVFVKSLNYIFYLFVYWILTLQDLCLLLFTSLLLLYFSLRSWFLCFVLLIYLYIFFYNFLPLKLLLLIHFQKFPLLQRVCCWGIAIFHWSYLITFF